MPILRHKHECEYTVVPNFLLRDKRLSLRDVGLLTFMLSLPENWEFSVAGLVETLGRDGRDAISKSLIAIEKAGYLTRERTRPAGGRIGPVVWTVSDTPSPQTDLPHTVLPDADLPYTGNPSQIKYKKKKVPNKENNNSTRGENDFDLFWSAYPKKVGKQAAKKAFSRVKTPVETLLTAVERQKCSAQWSRDNGQYIPNPATWLNQGRWEDELSPIQGSLYGKEKLNGKNELQLAGHIGTVV